MFKLTKFYPKDLIAIIVLLACFLLMAMGINTYVAVVIAVVVGYYFGRRIDGEGEPGKDINQRMMQVEDEVRTTLPFKSDSSSEPPAPKPVIATKLPEPLPKTTGDFKFTPKRIQ